MHSASEDAPPTKGKHGYSGGSRSKHERVEQRIESSAEVGKNKQERRDGQGWHRTRNAGQCDIGPT